MANPFFLFLRNIFSKLNLYPFLVIAASVVGISALTQPGIILTHDGLFHLHRMVAFDQALREGDFYPRWFPEFALGYGYPVLNFYAPFSYYVAEFFHLLGFGLASAEKLTFAMSAVLSGVTMYVWISEAFDSRRAGFVAAVAYMYFPYRMTDLYVRGSLAECLAFVFLPLLLWSANRLVVKNKRNHLLYSAVFLALLVLTHNITALFFVPIWLGYAFLQIFFGPGSDLKDIRAISRKVLVVMVSLFLGLAISAFYWLPALLEQAYASTSNFKEIGDDPVTQINAFNDLVQTGLLYDYIKRPMEAGLVQLIIFVVAVFAFILLPFLRRYLSFSTRPYILHGLFFLLLSVAGISMMSPAGIPVWISVPLIDNIQFPWRLLGFVGLGTAVLTALLALTRRSFFLLGLPAVAALTFSTMFGMPLLHINVDESDLTIPEAARYEFDSGVIGGTASAEYLPVWARPGFGIPLDNTSESIVEEKPASSIDIRVNEASRDHYRLLVTSERGGPLRLHQFFFPGWQAKLDGNNVDTYPSTSIGLVTVDVPPGEHDLEVGFGNNELRSIATGISVAATLLLIFMYAASFRRRQGVNRFSVPVLSVAVLIFYSSAGFPPAPQKVQGPELTSYSFRSQIFDLGSLRLAGFGLDTRKTGKEGQIKVDLFWQSLGKKEDSKTRLSLKNADGQVVGSRLVRPVYGTDRTYLWSTDELVKDEIYLPVETAIEPGRYTLELNTETGTGTLPTVELGTFQLPQVNVVKNVPPMTPVNLTFDEKILLLGYTAYVKGKELKDERTPLGPGDTVSLTLYWKALKDMDTDYTVFLHLLDAQGIRLAQVDSQPRAGFSQMTQWLRGDLVADSYDFYLPERLPMGIYRLDMGLYYLRTMARLPIDGQTQNSLTLKRLKIIPKEKSNEAPVRTTDVLLGGAVRLAGATIGGEKNGIPDQANNTINPKEDSKLHVKLFWRAEKVMDKDYTVFIHVLDSSGKVVAQVDRQPMRGAYPTSFWSPGESIMDDYDIILPDLPPGDYQLKVGAYLLGDMTNLTTSSGDSSVDAGSVHVKYDN